MTIQPYYPRTPSFVDRTYQRPLEHVSDNYIIRHWRGENTLWDAWWINGVLLSIPFKIFDAFVSFDLPPSQAWQWGYVLLGLVVFTWANWGIWRSAVRYNKERGWWSWGLVAIAIASVNLVSLGLVFVAIAKVLIVG
jgi:hypothetical protein